VQWKSDDNTPQKKQGIEKEWKGQSTAGSHRLFPIASNENEGVSQLGRVGEDNLDFLREVWSFLDNSGENQVRKAAIT
jgi:hypothetical protein